MRGPPKPTGAWLLLTPAWDGRHRLGTIWIASKSSPRIHATFPPLRIPLGGRSANQTLHRMRLRRIGELVVRLTTKESEQAKRSQPCGGNRKGSGGDNPAAATLYCNPSSPRHPQR